MSKTHYDPFMSTYDQYGEDSSEKGYCGTYLQEDSLNVTNLKDYVTCKKCIKLFNKSDLEMKSHNENFAKDCQQFVDFINDNKNK